MKKFIEKLKNISIPLCLIVAYLSKTLVLGAQYVDAAMLLVLAITYLGSRYFKTKELLITENQFRDQVNNDMREVKQIVSAIKVQKAGNFLKPQR